MTNKPWVAYIQCWWWCLRHIPQGHCMYTVHGGSGKLYEIAAVTGRISDYSINKRKVFYWIPGMTVRPEGNKRYG